MPKISTLLGENKDSARAVAVDAFNAMSDEEQAFLKVTARLLIDAYDAGVYHMPDFFKAQRLDQEEVLAIWSQLPSYVRAAIKRRDAP